MRISRRAVIVSIIGVAMSVPFIKKLFPPRSINHDPNANFSALIDTFVPADQYPGALDLEIDKKLMGKVKKTEGHWDLVAQYLNIVDQLSIDTLGKNFSNALLEQRTNLIETVLDDDSNVELQLQLKTLKNQTFTLFYTSQTAFDMLAYHPPSQGGYPNYDQPL